MMTKHSNCHVVMLKKHFHGGHTQYGVHVHVFGITQIMCGNKGFPYKFMSSDEKHSYTHKHNSEHLSRKTNIVM